MDHLWFCTDSGYLKSKLAAGLVGDFEVLAEGMKGTSHFWIEKKGVDGYFILALKNSLWVLL